MIKFEEQNGLIFKMLEEPVPLKENDENVLVRFITQGIIGEYVMEHWLDCNQENLPIYVDDVDSDGDVTVWIDENRNSHHCCPFPMFEVIGTLVKEGSADWACYQMVNGEKICHYKSPSIMYCENAGYIRREVRYNCVDHMSVSVWLNGADKNGWQIYKEPKPTFKVGDWVKYMTLFLEVIEPSGKNRTTCRTPSGTIIYPPTSYLTKLDPSEVVITIGCLTGTVAPVSINGIHLWFHLVGINSKTIATIRIESLDTYTRELVESLLKAQEEEK
jgi:hypothetical protein